MTNHSSASTPHSNSSPPSVQTRIHTIDHLISDGNYSTTITLAYTEAVREVGEAMIDTCFLFLVSDYIFADGSFANVLKRMQQGMSAVVAGNLQVARESALPWLQERLAGNERSLSLQPRELMQWALNNLHPIVLANMVNLPFSHNTDSNRLFWRVDGNTILGRFYLHAHALRAPRGHGFCHRLVLRLFVHSRDVPVGKCRHHYGFR